MEVLGHKLTKRKEKKLKDNNIVRSQDKILIDSNGFLSSDSYNYNERRLFNS